jgi:phosphoadenylyl-sulfate reductase (thioredoxin)
MSIDLVQLSREFEGRAPEDTLRRAVELFPGRLGFGTGLGAEGCVLVDIVARHELPIDIYILDTGVLFPETYELWKRIEERYRITIRAVKPLRTMAEQALDEGPALWERDPDRCCQLRKLEPQARENEKFDAWISALRREQTGERAQAQVFERDRRFGLVKVNPLVTWTNTEVWTYVLRNRVPYNPLHDSGYPSIGCHLCTSPVLPGEDPRAGRWRGKAKTECGLHTAASDQKTLIPLAVTR